MRERDRLEHRAFIEQERARESEEALASKLSKAEQEFQKNARELAEVTRKNLLSVKDDGIFIDPLTVGKRVTVDEAGSIARKAAEEFVAATPDYYPCATNLNALMKYFEVNEVFVLTPSMISAAYDKLRNAGLITARPAESEPVIEEPVTTIEPESEEIGIDQSTGQPRAYTRWEIDRMSAEEYRRVFRIRGMSLVQIDPRTRKEAM